jgi:hypothetical protein
MPTFYLRNISFERPTTQDSYILYNYTVSPVREQQLQGTPFLPREKEVLAF